MSNGPFGNDAPRLCRVVRSAYKVMSDEPRPDEAPTIYIRWWLDLSLGPEPGYGPADDEWYLTKQAAIEAADSYRWVVVDDAEITERMG